MSDVLYIHLSDDGGIFLIWRDSGRRAWVCQRELIAELDKLKECKGSVLYSQDPSSDPPPAIAVHTLNLIKSYSLEMVAAPQPHPHTRRQGRSTTLMVAAYNNDETLTNDLVERGADLEARDVEGYTPLMYACNKGNERIVEILLAAGGNPNARAADNTTPLMFASQHGDTGIVRKLIGAGADPQARGDHGLSALGFAEQNGHIETVEYLRSV